MVTAHRRALERLWKDRCTISQRVKVIDPDTKLTRFTESTLLEDQPCKLSFETLSVADGSPVAAVSQGAKLFLSPDVMIPAGCKIIIKRHNDLEREFTYAKSGEAGVFTNHQEIPLELFRGWA